MLRKGNVNGNRRKDINISYSQDSKLHCILHSSENDVFTEGIEKEMFCHLYNLLHLFQFIAEFF